VVPAAGRASAPPDASYHPAMTATSAISRRLFLVDLGRAGLAVAVLGVAGCAAPGDSPTQRASAASDAQPSPSDGGTPSAPASAGTSGAPSGSGSGSGSAGPTAWHRVNLGFVSAYVLARGGQAAVVDTGVPGSDAAIADALDAAGLGWGDVGHVILTHQHQDHAGSAAAVLDAAPGATGYAGAEDIPAIAVPRALVPVADGDDVFGLRIVATPGHTQGHVAVLDPSGGILVAGDALGTTGGKPTPPNPGFTEDMDQAMASIAKLGSLPFETLLVGHGEPIESGAAGLVKALGAG
jgi:glyoxylase-like metal-dependent hydrolase (beta-lactamase superfamily II)